MECRLCDEDVVNSGLCRKHYNDKMKVYMLDRYHRRRTEAIVLLGGECVRCGTTEDLEFDHTEARHKALDMGKIFAGGSKTKVAEELAKCQLLCNTHHIEKSMAEQDIPNVEHGGGLTGKRNCLCDLCRPLKNAYMREWKRNHRL